MKFLIQVLAILITAWILTLFTPWWALTIPAFLFGWLLRSNYNFLAGFLAIFLLWGIKAWLINASADAPLAERIAQVLMVKSDMLLILVTAAIGGLVGGFAALTGSLLNQKKKRWYY
jgi:hypothetical protein